MLWNPWGCVCVWCESISPSLATAIYSWDNRNCSSGSYQSLKLCPLLGSLWQFFPDCWYWGTALTGSLQAGLMWDYHSYSSVIGGWCGGLHGRWWVYHLSLSSSFLVTHAQFCTEILFCNIIEPISLCQILTLVYPKSCEAFLHKWNFHSSNWACKVNRFRAYLHCNLAWQTLLKAGGSITFQITFSPYSSTSSNSNNKDMFKQPYKLTNMQL